MSGPRTVLMACYYFPPLGGIGSLRALGFARHLPEFGWEPIVVAPRGGAYYRDETLAFPEERVTRTGSLEISALGRRALGVAPGEGTPSESRPTLRRLARHWLYFPDAQVGWWPFAARAGRALLLHRRVDAVFSSSFPVTSHLVGRGLARVGRVPWVAEFRDPWSAALPAGHPRQGAAERLERSLASEADAVVTVSPRWAEHYEGLGSRRTRVITNGFDPELVVAPRSSGKLVITHAGTLYTDTQDLTAVWASLRRLRAEERPDLRLRFVGVLPGPAAAAIAAQGLETAIEVTGFVPHAQAVALLAESAVLIVAGPRSRTRVSDGWIPAKVFEYLASGLPILHAGPAGTDLDALLSRMPGCFRADPSDAGAAYEALRAAIACGPVPRAVAPYARRELARQLAAVLSETVAQ